MREIVQVLASQIAHTFRSAISSKSAAGPDIGARLGKLLPPDRLWALSVILASWYLSKDEANRGDLNKLLRASGVPSMWPQLDLFDATLTPLIEASRDARTIEQYADAVIRLFEAVNHIKLRLLESVVESKAFKNAARVIDRDINEREYITIDTATNDPSKRENEAPKAETPKANAKAEPPTAKKHAWTKADAELEDLATDFLLLAGWNRAEVEHALSGKKGQ